MPFVKTPSSYRALSSGSASTDTSPGRPYCNVSAAVSHRATNFRVAVVEAWGSNQGTLEEHGRRAVSAHGDSISGAVRECIARAREAGFTMPLTLEALSEAEDEALNNTENE